MEATVLIYEVSALVEAELSEAFEHYMRDEHIPAVLATGCFHGASFERAEDGRYRMLYRIQNQAALDLYLREHAASLRADFAARFPGGVVLSRQTWTTLADWPARA